MKNALAARTGLFLALLAFPAAARADVGKLAVSVGTVEVKAPGAEAWAPLPRGGPLAANSWVRTDEASKALFDLAGGTEVRIDRSTEVRIQDARRMTLKAGEILVRGPLDGTKPFQVTASRTVIRTEGTQFTVKHETKKQTTTIIMIRGKSVVSTRRDRQNLMAGYFCTTYRGALNTPDQSGDPSMVTAWCHALLAQRGEKGMAELNHRFKKMTVLLGMLGENGPYERAFRDSGPAAAPFLLAFLKTRPDARNYKKRIAASRVLADVAALREAPGLVDLLDDTEPDVRVFAARGLKRLAGDDLGHGDDFWKGDARAAGIAKWKEWLRQNESRIPK